MVIFVIMLKGTLSYGSLADVERAVWRRGGAGRYDGAPPHDGGGVVEHRYIRRRVVAASPGVAWRGVA